MKLPGPNGVITVTGGFRKSLECTSAGGSLADSQVIAEEKRQLGKLIAMAQAQNKAPLPVCPAKRADEESAFQSANDNKKVALDPSDSTKFVVVRAGLSDKKESELVEFLHETGDIFACSPQDILGLPRKPAEEKLHIRP